MTMIRASGEFEQRDDWGTDPEILYAIRLHVDIGIDLAASEGHAAAKRYFTPEDSLFDHPASEVRAELAEIGGIAWLNPPFSQAEAFFDYVIRGRIPTLAIYKSNNLAVPHWQRIASECHALRILRGRRAYVSAETGELETSPSFHSVLISFHCDALTARIPENDPDVGGVTMLPYAELVWR